MIRVFFLLLVLCVGFSVMGQEEGGATGTEEGSEKDKKEVEVPKMESKVRQSRNREDLVRDVGKSKSYKKKKEGRKLTKEQKKERRKYNKLRRKQQRAKTTRRMKQDDRAAKSNNSDRKEPVLKRMWHGVTSIQVNLRLGELWYKITNKNHQKPSKPPKKKKQGKRKLRFIPNDVLGEKKNKR